MIILAAASMASPVFASEGPVTIKFSHVVSVDTPKGQAAEYFKKLVEERSKGAIKVEVYPNATLYDAREAVEALSMNALQMTAPSFSKFTSFIPQLQLFDLPFLFDNADHLHRVLDGDVGRRILRMVEKKGLVGLSYWNNGFKHLSANRPLLEPADATGLTFRTMSSRVLEAQFKAINADPRVLPFSEVYQALLTGTVDGQENTLSNIFTKNFHEVQSDLTLTNHGYLGYLVVTNELFWDKLSEEQRDIISEAMTETTRFARLKADELNKSHLERIRSSGIIAVHELTPEQRAKWKKALLTIYPEFYDVIGKDLIDDALAVGEH
ncbi:MAG: TRAP transporter substrate-binding protein [Desulfuromonadales bacterium]|nr:TRAP transporter substrate-binding protein [Desulfuromonadales bacterium]NIR34081.1 TRAP transporter substrate-binding protein [Desulfuromonadales bacterium]NIS40180.1 TRAP transporter substrate-binding protein [Desulfuromonadales bacterium]